MVKGMGRGDTLQVREDTVGVPNLIKHHDQGRRATRQEGTLMRWWAWVAGQEDTSLEMCQLWAV